MSDQNAEEQPGEGASDTSHRPDDKSDGSSGEGSQSTGHPDSAG